MNKQFLRTALPVLLAGLLAACSPKHPAPAPVVVTSSSELAALRGAIPSRDPALRQIGAGTEDSALLAKIAACRAKLPEEYQKRNNYAWAWARIETVAGDAPRWRRPAEAWRRHALPEFDMRLAMIKRACQEATAGAAMP